MKTQRIAVIGAGNMGVALLRGILASGWGNKTNLVASHPKAEKASALADELGLRVAAANAGAAREPRPGAERRRRHPGGQAADPREGAEGDPARAARRAAADLDRRRFPDRANPRAPRR